MTSCSWCHTRNDDGAVVCVECRHNPCVPRAECRCQTCTLGTPPPLTARLYEVIHGPENGQPQPRQ